MGLAELKKLIDTHFAQRKKDEEELDVLKSQIDKRKDVRAKQIEERARKQQEKMEREKEEKNQGRRRSHQAKSRRGSQEEGSYGCYVYELFWFHGQETGRSQKQKRRC